MVAPGSHHAVDFGDALLQAPGRRPVQAPSWWPTLLLWITSFAQVSDPDPSLTPGAMVATDHELEHDRKTAIIIAWTVDCIQGR